jgi:hypothetical protein
VLLEGGGVVEVAVKSDPFTVALEPEEPAPDEPEPEEPHAASISAATAAATAHPAALRALWVGRPRSCPPIDRRMQPEYRSGSGARPGAAAPARRRG